MNEQVSLRGDKRWRKSTNTASLSRTRDAKPDNEASRSTSRNGRFGHQVWRLPQCIKWYVRRWDLGIPSCMHDVRSAIAPSACSFTYDLAAPPHLPKRCPASCEGRCAFRPPIDDKEGRKVRGTTQLAVGHNGGTFKVNVTNQPGLPSPSRLRAGATRMCYFHECAQTGHDFDPIESHSIVWFCIPLKRKVRSYHAQGSKSTQATAACRLGSPRSWPWVCGPCSRSQLPHLGRVSLHRPFWERPTGPDHSDPSAALARSDRQLRAAWAVESYPESGQRPVAPLNRHFLLVIV